MTCLACVLAVCMGVVLELLPAFVLLPILVYVLQREGLLCLFGD